MKAIANEFDAIVSRLSIWLTNLQHRSDENMDTKNKRFRILLGEVGVLHDELGRINREMKAITTIAKGESLSVDGGDTKAATLLQAGVKKRPVTLTCDEGALLIAKDFADLLAMDLKDTKLKGGTDDDELPDDNINRRQAAQTKMKPAAAATQKMLAAHAAKVKTKR